MYFLKIKSNSFIFFFSRYLSGNVSQLLFFLLFYIMDSELTFLRPVPALQLPPFQLIFPKKWRRNRKKIFRFRFFPFCIFSDFPTGSLRYSIFISPISVFSCSVFRNRFFIVLLFSAKSLRVPFFYIIFRVL